MADEEKDIVTVENEGGKGNPNHVPAGSPEGGQFTSGDAPKTGALYGKLTSFIAKKHEETNKEANEYVQSVQEYVPEAQKSMYSGLSHDEKVALLLNSKDGLDEEKIKSATDEQLMALLYAQSVKNHNIQVDQQIKLVEKRKEEIHQKMAEKLAENNIDFIDGVWKYSTKFPSEWKELEESGSIQAKKDYYQGVLDNPDSPLSEKMKATQNLGKLKDFEKAGQDYEKVKGEVELQYLDELTELDDKWSVLWKEYNSFEKDSEIYQSAQKFIDKFVDNDNPYSVARKNKATWFNSNDVYQNQQDATAHFGPRSQEMWSFMSYSEQQSLLDYTGSPSKFNEPLRNMVYSGNKSFEGYGSDNSKHFSTAITNMTNAIDKCVWNEDFWCQRGVPNYTKMFDFPGMGGKVAIVDLTKAQLKQLEGQVFIDNGFYSAGAGKGTGFAYKDLIINTYCPKGTKAAYMNVKGQYAHSNENEMILQRGYSYRITKVEKKGSQYYVDCEVILDSDKNKPVGDELVEIGKKYNY